MNEKILSLQLAKIFQFLNSLLPLTVWGLDLTHLVLCALDPLSIPPVWDLVSFGFFCTEQSRDRLNRWLNFSLIMAWSYAARYRSSWFARRLFLWLARWRGTRCQTTREKSPSTRTRSDNIWRRLRSHRTDAYHLQSIRPQVLVPKSTRF